jgi:two-component system OmpR family response regulator
MNVLIVEDDASVARFLKQAVEEAGFTTQVVEDGQVALEVARNNDFDIVLLDVMIPSMDGFEVCRRLRDEKVSTPILFLTAKDMVEDKVTGLDSGGDDYIVKPFQVAELLARIRALVRRGNTGPAVLEVGDLSLDPTTRRVTRGKKEVTLSATEYMLLEYLMRNPGRLLTRGMILEHVWRYDFGGNDGVLDVYISYLRKKLDRNSAHSIIQTVRGIGYRLVADESS